MVPYRPGDPGHINKDDHAQKSHEISLEVMCKTTPVFKSPPVPFSKDLFGFDTRIHPPRFSVRSD